MSTCLRVNEEIPLTLQIERYVSGEIFYCKAVLKDDNGDDIKSVALTDKGSGFFQDKSELMPDKPFITAFYEVYLDSGYTQKADFIETFDVFVRDESIVNPCEQVGLSESLLRGELNASELVGLIKNQVELIGFIGENKLVGEIKKESDIIGTLNTNNLIAGITGCSI